MLQTQMNKGSSVSKTSEQCLELIRDEAGAFVPVACARRVKAANSESYHMIPLDLTLLNTVSNRPVQAVD